MSQDIIFCVEVSFSYKFDGLSGPRHSNDKPKSPTPKSDDTLSRVKELNRKLSVKSRSGSPVTVNSTSTQNEVTTLNVNNLSKLVADQGDGRERGSSILLEQKMEKCGLNVEVKDLGESRI